MTVYVGPIFAWTPTARWRWRTAAHLMADTEDELHEFAHRLGLLREWFQDNPRLPHYDLTIAKRRLAVDFGATSLNRDQEVARYRPLPASRRRISSPSTRFWPEVG